MALSFTDSQIKELTGQVLAAPDTIASLNADKAAAVARKADFLFLDEANEVYTDHFLNLMVRYHEELKYLNAQIRTNYNVADIDSSGRLAPGNPHFPFSPVWPNFPPKKIDSNEGVPFGTLPDTEVTASTKVNDSIDSLLNGFSDGATTSVLTIAYAAGSFGVLPGTGPSVGNRVVINGSIYGTVVSVTPTPTLLPVDDVIVITELNPGSAGIGDSCVNFDPGFSNAEREQTVVSHAAGYQSYLEGIIDTNVASVETYLQGEKTALLANDAPAPDKAEIDQAKLDVQAAIDAIDAFQAAPGSGAGVGRFGDTILGPLQAILVTRTSQIPTRTAQIISRLGNINQNPDGTFTGTGQYFNFFDSLNFRLNKASGTLRNFWQMDLIISVFDEQIATLVALQVRDSASFSIFEFAATANGTTTVQLVNATGLAPLQAVKVMSNTQPVFDAVIQSIALNTVVLDLPVPATYTIGDKARLVFVN